MSELTMNDPRARRLLEAVKKTIETDGDAPFSIAIMGQTGVGKSSLINALFGTKLKTDPVKPCTMDIEQVTVRSNDGHHEMHFFDLPGIGESEQADAAYLTVYQRKLLEVDVVLWGIHADNRSVTFDVQALHNLLGNLTQEQQVALMSKVTFVLTKADVLSPPPWIVGDMGKYSIFTPGPQTQDILNRKELYYQDVFLRPYGNLIIAQTYNDEHFNINEPPFSYSEYAVYYHGLLAREGVTALKQRYPKFSAVFDRLYDNYRVIACSSLFKYNLTQLMLVILNKLGPRAIQRFERFVQTDTLNQVPLDVARKMSNLIIYDPIHKQKVFDLATNTYPQTKRGLW